MPETYLRIESLFNPSFKLKIGSEARCVRMRIDKEGMILYWDFLKSVKFRNSFNPQDFRDKENFCLLTVSWTVVCQKRTNLNWP